VREAVEHAALGFSSSRTLVHIAIDGEPVPGTFAAEDELRAFARVLGELGRGIFEVAPAGVVGEDLSAPEKEMAWMRRVSADTGCPITFLLAQHNSDPRAWRRMLALCDEAASDGARVYPQVFGRPTNILFSFRSVHPFFRHLSLRATSRRAIGCPPPRSGVQAKLAEKTRAPTRSRSFWRTAGKTPRARRPPTTSQPRSAPARADSREPAELA
jgi:N-acyl-D-aspartate/D-glutamate deacylase